MIEFEFEFNISRVFQGRYCYQGTVEAIKQIRTRCPIFIFDYKKYYELSKIFNIKKLYPYPDKETCFDALNYDIESGLNAINFSISGWCGYDLEAIADTIDHIDRAYAKNFGLEIDDSQLNKKLKQIEKDIRASSDGVKIYKLKPEYSKLLIDSLDALEIEMRKKREAYLSEIRGKSVNLDTVKQSIKSIETSMDKIEDEGGDTEMYTHTITLHDGEKLTFTERNLFDDGTIINPAYSVVPGIEPGGLYYEYEGCYQWHDYIPKKGWVPVRPLTENEMTAIWYLEVFGPFSDYPPRMW